MFLEVVYGGPFNRGTLIPKSELPKYIEEAVGASEDLYRSMYLYTKDVVGKQIKGYLGPRDIDNIVLDIDKGDSSDEYTLEKARTIADELRKDKIAFIPYFSGTGYHLQLNRKALDVEINADLPYIIRKSGLFYKHT